MTIWTHGSDTLESFLDYLNHIDLTGKIKFNIQVTDEDGIDFLDLKLKLKNSKIAVDVFAKPINSFTYVVPTNFYPRKSLNIIPRGIALHLKRICDTININTWQSQLFTTIHGMSSLTDFYCSKRKGYRK